MPILYYIEINVVLYRICVLIQRESVTPIPSVSPSMRSNYLWVTSFINLMNQSSSSIKMLSSHSIDMDWLDDHYQIYQPRLWQAMLCQKWSHFNQNCCFTLVLVQCNWDKPSCQQGLRILFAVRLNELVEDLWLNDMGLVIIYGSTGGQIYESTLCLDGQFLSTREQNCRGSSLNLNFDSTICTPPSWHPKLLWVVSF